MNMCGSGDFKSGADKAVVPTSRSGVTCNTCGGMGHYARDCPSNQKAVNASPTLKISMAVTKITIKDEYNQQLPEVKKQLCNCPAFKQTVHVRTVPQSSRRLDSCPQLQSKTAGGEVCFNRNKTNCTVMAGGQTCDGVHPRLWHGSGVAFCHRDEIIVAGVAAADIIALGDMDEDIDNLAALTQYDVLLEVMVHGEGAKTMFDGGSSGALMTNSCPHSTC